MTNKFLIRLSYIIWICFAQFLVASTSAQSFDVEPPVIDHDVVEASASAETQTFFANVADDVELGSVRFFYRFEGESQYTSVIMERVATSSTYSVQVETEVGDDRAIEYYFEARDVSGNRTLRGYNFSPLERLIEVPQLPAEPVVAEGPKPINRRPIYYVVGGVVAVALLGALVSGSSGGGGGGDPIDDPMVDDPMGPGNFTLTINAPGQ